VREEVSMAPYSMDLRTRVLRDWDTGMRAEDVAAKYSVSRAWVHRLQQRRRETGSIAPRKQTRWRTPILTAQLPQLEALIQEQPDRTLAELRPRHRGQPDDPLACDRAPRDHGQKKPYARPSKIARTSSWPGVSGSNSRLGSTRLAGCFLMKAASRRI
jgi:transposase